MTDDVVGTDDPVELVRQEERLVTGTERHEVGGVRFRKEVDLVDERLVVDRGVEHADVDRIPAVDGGFDSGQIETLPDGSISIPVFEERLVVEKRLVVRERIIVRKHTVTDQRVVEAELARERVEIDVDEAVRERVEVQPE